MIESVALLGLAIAMFWMMIRFHDHIDGRKISQINRRMERERQRNRRHLCRMKRTHRQR